MPFIARSKFTLRSRNYNSRCGVWVPAHVYRTPQGMRISLARPIPTGRANIFNFLEPIAGPGFAKLCRKRRNLSRQSDVSRRNGLFWNGTSAVEQRFGTGRTAHRPLLENDNLEGLARTLQELEAEFLNQSDSVSRGLSKKRQHRRRR